MRSMPLRAIFLLGFVVAMPLLALPPVARQIDELLYGPPPANIGQPPAKRPAPSAGLNSDAPTLSQSAVTMSDRASRPIAAFAESTSPPLLSTIPPFEPPAPAPADESKIDDRTIARLQQIRQRLEELGADHVIVETQGSGLYRFQCQMLVDERSRYTRPFEASGVDPIGAGERVLEAVENWRAGAIANRR
jgi:hypothetical protein